ncbi:hypothetical protein, partial [Rhodococcus chondri]
MFLLDDVLIYSARDVAEAAGCEFALLSNLDATLDPALRLAAADDPMLERTARLGGAHEQRALRRYQ